jgi:hypothetical protein
MSRAEGADSIPDVCGVTIEMFGISRRNTAAEATTAYSRRQIPNETQEET